MEYPMLMFNQPYPDAQEFYALTVHEAAHQWYPMMVGSNEWRYAWQDEGLATYMENIAVAAEYPAFQPFRAELLRYLPVAGTELEHPIMRAADLYGPDGAYFIGAYSKPGVLLNALATIIGRDTLEAALREYRDRWFLRHPQAIDFFRSIEAVAGRDLRWFWRSWWYETVVLDQAIEAVELTAAGGGERAAITIADQGGVPMPVDLVLTLANGETRRITVPVDVWLAGARTHTRTVELPAALQRVEIDPEADFPDVDRGDNVWQRAGAR
jgi:aminopeptidase N